MYLLEVELGFEFGQADSNLWFTAISYNSSVHFTNSSEVPVALSGAYRLVERKINAKQGHELMLGDCNYRKRNEMIKGWRVKKRRRFYKRLSEKPSLRRGDVC